MLFLILGEGSLDNIYTFLHKATVFDEANNAWVLDLANSIYIDWGAFISAIINFFIIAFVLFLIVKFINRIQEGSDRLKESIKENKPTKEDRKIMKARGIKLRDKKAVDAYMEEKKALIQKEKEEAEAKAKAEEEEKKKNSTEGLLKQIKELLEKTMPKEAPKTEEATEDGKEEQKTEEKPKEKKAKKAKKEKKADAE